MRKAYNLPPSCAVVTKSGKFNFLEHFGPLQACNGTVLPFACGRDSVFIRTVKVKNSWSFFRNPHLSSRLESTPRNIAGYISILGYDTQSIFSSYRHLGET